MSYREAKKERELMVCTAVAAEINRVAGTDYYPDLRSSEPADVILTSRSGRFEARQLQVVSLPVDHTIRPDNHNVQRFRRQFLEALVLRRFRGFDAHVHLTDQARRAGVPSNVVTMLADFVTTHWDRRQLLLLRAEDELYAYEPVLCEFFNYVRLFSFESDRTDVSVPLGFWTPRDGTWVRAAIEKKTKKYDRVSLAKLTLVVDGSVHLHSEQIESFRRELGNEELPFREVWTVSMGKAAKLSGCRNSPEMVPTPERFQ